MRACACPPDVSPTYCMEIRYGLQPWDDQEICECLCHYPKEEDGDDAAM